MSAIVWVKIGNFGMCKGGCIEGEIARQAAVELKGPKPCGPSEMR